MKKFTCTFVLITFVSTFLTQEISLAVQQESERYSLAVLNFAIPDGSISPTEARVLTARFTDEISDVGLFFTMSQSDMERGLVLKNLDPSGCETFDCALRAGSALDVQLVVFGSIRQSRNGYDLDVQMVHATSGREVKTLSDSYRGGMNGLLEEMPMFARKLVGKSTPRTAEQTRRPPAEPQPQYEDSFQSGNGGFKWHYVGIGLLIAGGVGAGVFLAQQSDSEDGETTTPPPLSDLPGPPTFP